MTNPINTITDPEGIRWFESYLRKNGFINIQLPPTCFYPFDLQADKDGTHYYFELKLRPCHSTAFNDSIIELQKYNTLRGYNGEKKIINFFNDCFYIVDIFDDHEYQTHYAQRTNNWNRDKVKKILVSYKHKESNKHNYND